MSALAWNTDIKAAPHGRYEVRQRREGVDVRVFVPERVILTTKCGKVTISHYLPEEKRWLMLGVGEQPLAWMPWPEPYSHSAIRNGANTENDHVDGGAARAGHAGRSDNALSGQVESRNSDVDTFDGNASLAAREGEKPLHSNPNLPSGAAACSADTAGTEPPPSVPADQSIIMSHQDIRS